jgi:2-polyprenyl-6-methoxyphenol hydroxylase-like FAD-dependent oxidoreductase
MSEKFDVIVVGGGLAGSSTASVPSRAGLDVLERETAFRDRVRGEWLAPWGILEAEALGIRDIIDAIPHANLITRHVGYDETVSPDEAEAAMVDFTALGLPAVDASVSATPQLQEALLANAAEQGATVRRGTTPAQVTAGTSPTVTYTLDGAEHTATGRLVVAADGSESGVRKGLGIELHATDPHVIMAGMLVDGIRDWPAEQQAIGVKGDFHYLEFPQTDGRARLYGAWPVAGKHRYSGDSRERRFLESFRLSSFPEPGAIADATPAGPLAGYPMTDTWTDPGRRRRRGADRRLGRLERPGDRAGHVGHLPRRTSRDRRDHCWRRLVGSSLRAVRRGATRADATAAIRERWQLPVERVRFRRHGEAEASACDVHRRPDEFAVDHRIPRGLGAARTGLLRRRVERPGRRVTIPHVSGSLTDP